MLRMYTRLSTPLITPRSGAKLGVKARTKTQQISLLQLNVWFAPLKDPKSEFKAYRTKAALDHLSKCNPNVICLQEVTQPFWNALLNYSFFRDDFSFTDFPDHLRRTSTPHSPHTYGVLVAVRNSLLGLGSCAWEQDLPTHMGRRMVGVDVVSPHGGPPLRIGTCHFESLWSSLETRKAQFEICTSLISPNGGPSIFYGDTNITGVKEVAPPFDAGLKDARNVMHPAVKLNPHVKGATLIFSITFRWLNHPPTIWQVMHKGES
ncbi:hypothetical protein FIBSPDRAFT_959161 [Athelia psychrophila]|uniref:Endonuclease/exonuclease/phosphatase domain-containing protein n=1 Tax=Athelia psychrophila TaxID=1759441 RepID=A0A166DSF3_9AGAM|nr:hypothetical protein FIBSPDRAFT_959161 [Fibularhizoctonia sp. CBS 109695]